MTVNEAIDRAMRIWNNRVTHVKIRQDGGADIETKQGRIASDTRGRNYVAHRLDVNGHATCHPDCARLEQETCG